VITALLEVGLSPVTWPGTASRMPISVLIAVVANFGLVYFTKYVTGSVGLAFVPAIGLVRGAADGLEHHRRRRPAHPGEQLRRGVHAVPRVAGLGRPPPTGC